MTSWEIIVVLGVAPLAIMVLLGLLTLGPNLRRAPSYRPGDEWSHPPVWWTANPERRASASHASHHQGGARAGLGGCSGEW